MTRAWYQRIDVAFVLVAALGVFVIVLLSKRREGATNPVAWNAAYQQTVATTQKPTQGSAKFVRQSGASPPPCGWHGCFTHPKKPQVKLPSRNLSNGKPWLDIAGLKEGDVSRWPRHNSQQFWNPYALNGREEDGGIVNEPGVMPVVDPPRDRYGLPYRMKPSWQTGSTALADFYKTKCAKRVKTKGRLYYVGPARSGKDGVQAGSYVWIIHPRNDVPSIGDGWTHFIPQPGESPVEEARFRNEDAADLLKQGAELPPWSRRGPHATEQAIRAHCK